MKSIEDAILRYVTETRRLDGIPSSIESTFYPDLKQLLGAVLEYEQLPFAVITGTSEGNARRRDMPDFVFGDALHFVGVYGEVKRADTTLEQRIRAYFDAREFSDVKRIFPDFAIERANYRPAAVWKEMRASGYEGNRILPYMVFPFDMRWIYYSEHPHFLDRHSPDFARNRESNEFLVTVPEPRKVTETIPLFASGLVGLHVHERGSVVIPRENRSGELVADRYANISDATWRVLRGHFALEGERKGDAARTFVGKLFRVGCAILHAPSYQAEHKSALSADWAHLPIPKDTNLFERLAAAGEQVTRLLDAAHDAADIVEAVVGADRARALGPLRRVDGKQVRPEDLKITITYWGGGKGRWKPRAFLAEELPAAEYENAWGERTGDLFLNDAAFFSNIPELVWTYQLGGYPVLKKWLSYRQADRRDGKPLTDDERRWFRQIIQRVAALLALGPLLDSLYQDTAANAFTAEELQIAREIGPSSTAALRAGL